MSEAVPLGYGPKLAVGQLNNNNNNNNRKWVNTTLALSTTQPGYLSKTFVQMFS